MQDDENCPHDEVSILREIDNPLPQLEDEVLQTHGDKDGDETMLKGKATSANQGPLEPKNHQVHI